MVQQVPQVLVGGGEVTSFDGDVRGGLGGPRPGPRAAGPAVVQRDLIRQGWVPGGRQRPGRAGVQPASPCQGNCLVHGVPCQAVPESGSGGGTRQFSEQPGTFVLGGRFGRLIGP